MRKLYTNKSVGRCLTKSKNGWYTFRRKVPVDVREAFGPAEIKKSLRTKDLTLALSAAAALYRDYEARFDRIRRAYGTLSGGPETKSETILEANRLAMDLGVHPDQAPILRAGASKEEREEFERREREYLDRRFKYFEAVHDADLLLDVKHREDAYLSGQFNTPQYRDKYLSPDVNNLAQATYAVVDGDAKALRSRSLKDALEVYLADPRRTRGKNPKQLSKITADKTRSVNRLAAYLGRSDTDAGLMLDAIELSKEQMTDYYNHMVLEAGRTQKSLATVNKTFGDVQAILTVAYEKWDIQKRNPCSKIVDKEDAEKEAKDRRSFRPDELAEYRKYVLSKNEQLALIGLIMIETGCRTSEATLLVNADVRLKAKVPFIRIRDNNLRRLDKKGLARDVPVTGELLEKLRAYNRPAMDKDAPFFPRYGKPNSPETVSQNLRNIVRKKMGVSDPTLVPYSTRHTFADRCISAEIFTPYRLYLMGHKNPQSTKIADQYVNARFPAKPILEAYLKQLSVSDWGDTGWDDEWL